MADVRWFFADRFPRPLTDGLRILYWLLLAMGIALAVIQVVKSKYGELWLPSLMVISSATVLIRDWVGRRAA